MKRINSVLRRYGWRTPIVVPAILAQRIAMGSRLRGLWLRLVTSGRKGSGVRFGRGLSVTPGSRLDVGDRAQLGDRATLEIGLNPAGVLSIGRDTWLSHDCHILCYRSVQIGENVIVGEFVSIRDSTHRLENTAQPIKLQGDKLGTIDIGDGAWIGRGCLIQGRPEGTVIGQGAVIAANSVVTRSVPAFEIWGGAPARLIRRREP